MPKLLKTGLSRTLLSIGALGVFGLMAIPFLGEFHQTLLLLSLFFAYVAVSWNIVGGFTGQLSIGHSIFIGAGAYTSAIFFENFGLTPWLAVPAAAAIGSVLGLVVGLLFFRYGLRGAFFALGTFALGEIVLFVVINTRALGGANGFLIHLTREPKDFQFDTKLPYVFIALALLMIGLLLSALVRYSRFGHALLAIREDEEAAESLGISIVSAKTRALMLSAAMSAVGGVFYAQYVLFVGPRAVLGETLSILPVIYAIFGGIGTIWGPAIGALVLYPATDYVRAYLSGISAGLDLIVLGVVLISAILLMPRGLVGAIRDGADLVQRMRGKNTSPVANDSDGPEKVEQSSIP